MKTNLKRVSVPAFACTLGVLGTVWWAGASLAQDTETKPQVPGLATLRLLEEMLKKQREDNDATFAKMTTIDVPVGAIIPFIPPPGKGLEAIGPNYQLCDGSVVKDKLSPFYDQPVPFITDGRYLAGWRQGEFVGRRYGSHRVSTDPSGNHSHDFNVRTSQHDGRSIRARGALDEPIDNVTTGHDHGVSGSTSATGNHTHDFSYAPQSIGVLFIVRIK